MMKTSKITALFLALAVMLSGTMSVFATEADLIKKENDQEGTQAESSDETFCIEDADDLRELAYLCRLDTWSVGKKVILNADIVLEETAFESIPSFAGVFDGNGHTISGLYLTDSITPSGFFGKIQATGIVKDLTVSGTVIPTGDARFVGGIAGENYGTVINCTFTGNVAGSGNTGGIVGINALGGKISGCDVNGLIIGSDMTGGIAGCNLGTVADSVSKASVNTVSVDSAVDTSNINFDFLTDVSKLTSLDVSSAATDTGGIAGYSSGIIKNCVNKSAVGYPHVGYNVGGIAGRSCGYVVSCTNAAEVYGRKDVGGIIGQMEPYIAKNLTESELKKLEKQFKELDSLLDTATKHAENTSDVLTHRLKRISSSVKKAASATEDIRTTGTVTGSVTGSASGSTGGSVTVKPLEGENGDAHVEDGTASGEGIHIGDGSISGEVGGSLSGSIEGEGNTSVEAGLDAEAQIDISTDLEDLSSALYGMAGQISLLSGELGDASEELLADAARIKDKINEITDSGFELLMGSDEEDIIIDDSSTVDIDQITLGKAYGCMNRAFVSGDINVGGIVGDMGVEYTLDPEDDLTVSIDNSTKRKYEVRAVIHKCKNTGEVLSKRNYVGGIVGRMDLGLAAGCESYGDVSSENGNYVGGIAGLCGSTIRSCFAKCSLSGGKYIGGIVGSGVEETKTGASSTVAGCYSVVEITDHEQYIGAVSGAYAGTFLENYFVSEELAGINRMSYTGCAQPLSYSYLQELPEEFNKFSLRFVVDEETVYSDVFDYGESFPDEIFPDIPQKEGYYAYWDRDTLDDLRFDTTVTAVYEPYISALASENVREWGKTIFFAEGDFGETDTLTATAVDLTPDAFHVTNGLWDTIAKSLRDGKINTGVVEQWQLSISVDDTKPHRIRYLPPEGDEEHLKVYALTDDGWSELETELIGSYLAFTVSENDMEIAVLHSINTWWAWLIAALLLAAAVILVIRAAKGHRKPKSPDALPPTEEKEAPERAPESEETAESVKPSKKRSRLTPKRIISAVLLLVITVSAFLSLPELIAGKGAYETLENYLQKDTVDMTLEVDAKIGGADFPVAVDIRRTSVDGERITGISQNGRTLYYADGFVILENGNTYRVGDSLPDYSQLLEHAMELYRYADVKATDGTYFITAQGDDAKEFLKLLLPSEASAIMDTDSVDVTLVTQDRQLSQIRFSGSGHLGDKASSAYTVDAVVTVSDKSGHAYIPKKVKEAMASAENDGTDILSEDVYRLLIGWQNLNSGDFWSARAELTADCGPLEVSESLDLCHWQEEDTSVYSVQENGYGLYMSGGSVCDRNGNAVSLSGVYGVDAQKLVDILYSLCMNASADCEHHGGEYTYTLALDADGMKSLAYVIAPETEKMSTAFTSGTLTVTMGKDEIRSVRIDISGNVQVLLTKAEADISAVLDFTKGEERPLPEAVKAALTGEM